MKTIRVGFCVTAFALFLSDALNTSAQAAGPALAQQSVSQIQSTLTDASVGCRRCGYRRGFAYGYGYGGYGGYGYYGWGYSRPAIYSYASYGYNQPAYYYSGAYGYSPGLTSCNCGGYGYASYQPAVYGMSNYSYPTQSVVYGTSAYTSPVVYSSPTYSSGAIYTPSSSYATPTYTPTYSSPSVISSPTPISPAAAPAPTPAPYPAPPVEYPQPSAYRAPIATLPMMTANSPMPLMNLPTYSASSAGMQNAAAPYGPTTYGYSSGSLANRLYSSAW